MLRIGCPTPPSNNRPHSFTIFPHRLRLSAVRFCSSPIRLTGLASSCSRSWWFALRSCSVTVCNSEGGAVNIAILFGYCKTWFMFFQRVIGFCQHFFSLWFLMLQHIILDVPQVKRQCCKYYFCMLPFWVDVAWDMTYMLRWEFYISESDVIVNFTYDFICYKRWCPMLPWWVFNVATCPIRIFHRTSGH